MKRYDSAGNEVLPRSYQQENPLDVLLDRRPDIQHLPLTCENTNTALPYLDVVNEIMEFFIANRLSLQLDASGREEYLGHDTGEAQSEDLLASPQNVLGDAYKALGGAFFPAPLPFDRSLEYLRLFFRKFEVPLPLAMETLLTHHGLERSGTDYGWRDILAEEIGLSPAEYGLLTTSDLAPNVLTKI